MWRWDQGHLAYFQFEALRRIATFVSNIDFRLADRHELLLNTGLSFKAPRTHTPWRQYARALKLALLISEHNGISQATDVAHLLATPGQVTCDEYMHFLARSFTQPSPAFEEWDPNLSCRYPLLFALRYVLAKCAVMQDGFSTLDEIIGAYGKTGFVGDEADIDFVRILNQSKTFSQFGKGAPDNLKRQARESLRVIAQISYLHLEGSELIVSLSPADAQLIFEDLAPVIGPRAKTREAEIRRLAALFRDGANEDFYEYPNTVLNDAIQSGFSEGTKVKRTHIVIERNSELRRSYFAANPVAVCDVCALDTRATYPWVDRVLDLHHLLPLASGTRVENKGTTLDDIVPICPTCHRAVHRFYDQWLGNHNLIDFATQNESRHVYSLLKNDFLGAVHA